MSVATLERKNDSQVMPRQTSRYATTWADRIETVGLHSIRYGLVLVLLWIGGMKFTSYESEAISGFVASDASGDGSDHGTNRGEANSAVYWTRNRSLATIAES